jgi:hypothetical protein
MIILTGRAISRGLHGSQQIAQGSSSLRTGTFQAAMIKPSRNGVVIDVRNTKVLLESLSPGLDKMEAVRRAPAVAGGPALDLH